ncbi:unnamed protein product [Heligmosomoides polygyrus]|uniref:RNA-directed DNA polymerase, eukaryota, reverse transcriptase zinc-binding domain protein n=1 Tax=Heligmosomoides polygyrus TaxID=6339 RepID=A0A183G025_HELPZ|nr:unnamed protein product [Heligmosomoides polygyrus]
MKEFPVREEEVRFAASTKLRALAVLASDKNVGRLPDNWQLDDEIPSKSNCKIDFPKIEKEFCIERFPLYKKGFTWKSLTEPLRDKSLRKLSPDVEELLRKASKDGIQMFVSGSESSRSSESWLR